MAATNGNGKGGLGRITFMCLHLWAFLLFLHFPFGVSRLVFSCKQVHAGTITGKVGKSPTESVSKMTTIHNIYDLLHVLHGALGDEYDEDAVNGECPGDTIKVSKRDSTNVMYVSFDVNYPSVIEAAVYDEPEGCEERDAWPIAEGICWDTEDEGITSRTIATDIAKYF